MSTKSCAGCLNDFNSKECMQCSICHQLYDLLCANVRDKVFKSMSIKHKSTWKCPSCLSKQPKDDNTNTPVRPTRLASSTTERSPLMSSPTNTNVTARSKSKKSQGHSPVQANDDTLIEFSRGTLREIIKQEIQSALKSLVSDQFKQINELIAGFNESLSFHNEKYEESKVMLEDISAQMKDLDRKMGILEGERNDTRIKIAELEERSESLERFVRKTCVEIRGVPKKKKERKEELLSMVTSLIKTTGLEFSPYDIKDIYRLPSKEIATTSTIVTEFSNNFFKDKFLNSVKQYNTAQRGRQLNSSHLGLAGPDTPLFISEHLTPKAKRLHFLARDFARVEHFQYCWISNGRVFLRKKEGERYTVVKNESTFKQLRELSTCNNAFQV